MRLFLSYGHDHNAPLVERIRADLEIAGHETWIDLQSIKAGDNWRRTILDGVRASDMTLAFLSKHSTRDPGVCLDELAIALHARGGNIATILLESELEVRPPVSVAHVQWLDMHDWAERQLTDPAAFDAWYRNKLDALLKVLDNPDVGHFAGEVEELAEWLRAVPQEADIAALVEGFTGRLWLLDALNTWRLTEPESRMFWISGAPGTGKSSFIAWLTHFARANVVGVVLCRHDMAERRDPARVVRTVAFQAATRLPDYRRLLLDQLRRKYNDRTKLDEQTPSSLFDDLLVQPLRLCIDGGRSADRVVALLDGLDETMRDGRSEIAELLAQQASKLPPWFGLVVTGRPEPAILRQFEGFQPHRIATDSWQNQTDLRLFVRTWLVSMNWAQGTLDDSINRILDAAQGSFLYVRLLKEGITAGIFDFAELERLPPGHASVFERWLRRQFPDQVSYRSVVPLLSLIRSCSVPVRLPWAEEALGLRQGGLNPTLEALGALFPVEGDAIRVCHKSLLDWLIEPRRSGPWFVPEANDRECMNLIRAIVRDMAVTAFRERVSGAVGHFDTDIGMLGACLGLAARSGYVEYQRAWHYFVPRHVESYGKLYGENRHSDLELAELEVIWNNKYPRGEYYSERFATFAFMVSAQYLAKHHHAFFGRLAARVIDIREDNLRGAMEFASGVLTFLNAAGHDDGPAVAAVRRAGAEALRSHGVHEESSRWTVAAETAERNP